ncbi:hypothetical protein P0Y35_04520 [Kiritimatiellaeota bacterium B1221]|nr:hypothetical protein [Kiritimatiellaeota bacterium B1221]
MSNSDIEIDEDPQPVKQKSATPLWMGIMVIAAFVCVLLTLALQLMEYQYFRGGSSSDSDIYAAKVLIPKR